MCKNSKSMKAKRRTNADLIRSMTNEELAEFLAGINE